MVLNKLKPFLLQFVLYQTADLLDYNVVRTRGFRQKDYSFYLNEIFTRNSNHYKLRNADFDIPQYSTVKLK